MSVTADPTAGTESMPAPPAPPRAAGPLLRPAQATELLRLVLALSALAAATIHFGFAPDHFREHWTHGLFFVVVGWLQLSWGLLLLTRPSRRLLWAGTANLLVIVVWVLSRSSGIPLVPLGSTIEPIGFPDSVATAMEAVVVYGSFALLTVRVRLVEVAAFRRTAPALASAAAGLALSGLTLASFTPALAGGHAEHAAAAGLAPHAQGSAVFTAGTTPCEQAGSMASTGVGDSHAHRGPVAQVPLDRATRAQLAAQQEQARTVAAAFPTVAAAEAGGYRMSTPYVPCIGAHYTNYRRALAFDPAAPSELLYAGTTPDSRLVGLSYLVYHPGGAPEGFAGPNDVWHQHNANGGLCIAAGVVIGSENATPAGCSALGGRKTPLVDVWMLHDWVVPGWECGWGTFAPDCPELGGRVGGSAWDTPVRGAVLPAG